MSGIYGIIEVGAKTDIKAFEKLSAWNSAYGNSGKTEEETFSADGDFAVQFGAGREFFKEENREGKAVFNDECFLEVYDTLLFGEKPSLEKNITDEEFVHRIIRKGDYHELEKVNGNFSGAVFDKEKRRLVLFADHMGTRTLYYYIKKGIVVFSTDIRGIASIDDVDTGINEEWLYKTMSGLMYLNPDRTEYEYIYCVPAGCYLSFEWNGENFVLEENRYWLPGSKKVRFSTQEEYFKKLRELTEDSIKIRLDAVEGKIGAELSGGLDSSVISILINRFNRECEYFSWSDEISRVPLIENDERLTIFDICKQEGITCDFSKSSYDFQGENIMNSRLPYDISEEDSAGSPYIRYAFPPFMNTYPLLETAEHMARKGVRVIFTGHAGDEGISHRCKPYELLYYGEYLEYLRNMWRRAYGQKHRVFKTFKKAYLFLKEGLDRRYKSFHYERAVGDFLKSEFVENSKKYKQGRLTFSFDPQEYILNGGSRNRLNVVELVGALCGVRYIAPYTDYRLIDFALGIPRHLYLNGSQNRYVYRMAFKDIMPKSLYKLQSKTDTSIAAGNAAQEEQEKPKEDEAVLRERRRKIIYSISREKWDKYLDYDLLDRWVEGTTGEDINEEWLFMCHPYLEMAENMVNKAKMVKLKED